MRFISMGIPNPPLPSTMEIIGQDKSSVTLIDKEIYLRESATPFSNDQ
jgi:hypothetical protein